MRFGWMWTLVAAAACNGGASSDRVAGILDLAGDSASGEAVYSSNCASCHGANGQGGSGPAMSNVTGLSDDRMVQTILDGKESMPPFDSLPDQDIADLVEYIFTTY
jgi:cytochrome c551